MSLGLSLIGRILFWLCRRSVTPYIGAIEAKENAKEAMARLVMKFGGTSVGDIDASAMWPRM